MKSVADAWFATPGVGVFTAAPVVADDPGMDASQVSRNEASPCSKKPLPQTRFVDPGMGDVDMATLGVPVDAGASVGFGVGSSPAIGHGGEVFCFFFDTHVEQLHLISH